MLMQSLVILFSIIGLRFFIFCDAYFIVSGIEHYDVFKDYHGRYQYKTFSQYYRTVPG